MGNRIKTVAQLLAHGVYNEEFAGKERGRFTLDRQQLSALLGEKRLRDTDLEVLASKCLNEGLALIDMGEKIGFAEASYVEKWRKLPDRLLTEYVSELDADEDDEDEEEEDDENEEE